MSPDVLSKSRASQNSCPIPKTHRRLEEAHVLWHQALDNYQDPRAFRANLNASIESLRNVTFVLQNEKHTFPDFDSWYAPWQTRLKTDLSSKWLHDARTTVVHQGELESYSTAELRVVAWTDFVVARVAMPAGTPSVAMLRHPGVLDALSKIPNTPLSRDAAIDVERRWSTSELGESEILETLAKVYGLVSDLILDAHFHLGQSACISADSAHPDFRSTYLRSGTLTCMTMGVEKRTQSFRLSNGEEFQKGESTVAIPEDEHHLIEAAQRYGFSHDDKLAAWEQLDPLNYAKKILYTAKRILSRDKRHHRMMFLRDGHGRWNPNIILAQDRTEKHLVMRDIARTVEGKSCDAIIEVGEAWRAPANSVPDFDPAKIQGAEGSTEVLFVVVATRDGFVRTFTVPFSRGPLGKIRFEEETQDADRTSLYYLKPVFDVWQKQGVLKLPDGRELRRLWDPDPLAICYCGGPKRFGECCMRYLPLETDHYQQVDEAIRQKSFERAENLARASLAQYVIWIKRHTTIIMHHDPKLHRQLADIDALALESLARRLETCLETSLQKETYIQQLRYLAETISVPRISMRLVALGARWLLRNGRAEEAVLELDSLGTIDKIEPDKLEDSLALLLIADICDLPPEREFQFLSRAVDVATDDERWPAKIELIGYLIRSAKYPEALVLVDSAISEFRNSKDFDEISDALFLRWKITKDAEDLHAFEAKVALTEESSRSRYAGMLIDEGLYSLAENLLANQVEKDPLAKLLVVNARTLSGDTSSAKTLFLTMEPEQASDRNRYFFAVVATQLALECKDHKIREIALRSIENVPKLRLKDPDVEKLFLQLKRECDFKVPISAP